MNAVDQAKPMKTPETEARNPLTQRLPTGPDELRPPPRVGEPQRRGQRQAGRHAAPASPPDPAPGTHQPSTPAAGNAASPINLTPPRGSSQSCWTRLSTTPCLPGEEVGNSDETNTEPFSDKYSRRWAQSEKLGAPPGSGVRGSGLVQVPSRTTPLPSRGLYQAWVSSWAGGLGPGR